MRTTIVISLLASLASALFATVAAAEPELTTPLITASNVGEGRTIECRWVNVSKKPVTVTADLIADDAILVSSSGACTVAPDEEGCPTSITCGVPAFACRAHCRFRGASKAKIRAAIILTPSSTGDTLVALPAE